MNDNIEELYKQLNKKNINISTREEIYNKIIDMKQKREYFIEDLEHSPIFIMCVNSLRYYKKDLSCNNIFLKLIKVINVLFRGNKHVKNKRKKDRLYEFIKQEFCEDI